ncbi:hypothetical protein [Sphingomonas sp.]|uniref:hypothetical protein n=1 Tax=Sphingomonas sp. TaxID=28214 RepID=UPI003B006CDF
MIVALGLASLLMATGQDASPPQPPAPAQASGGLSKSAVAQSRSARLLCREEVPIGSRLGGHRVCMTGDQWRERANNDGDTVGDTQRRAFSQGLPPH